MKSRWDKFLKLIEKINQEFNDNIIFLLDKNDENEEEKLNTDLVHSELLVSEIVYNMCLEGNYSQPPEGTYIGSNYKNCPCCKFYIKLINEERQGRIEIKTFGNHYKYYCWPWPPLFKDNNTDTIVTNKNRLELLNKFKVLLETDNNTTNTRERTTTRSTNTESSDTNDSDFSENLSEKENSNFKSTKENSLPNKCDRQESDDEFEIENGDEESQSSSENESDSIINQANVADTSNDTDTTNTDDEMIKNINLLKIEIKNLIKKRASEKINCVEATIDLLN